jgi:hypothetical protein
LTVSLDQVNFPIIVQTGFRFSLSSCPGLVTHDRRCCVTSQTRPPSFSGCMFNQVRNLDVAIMMRQAAAKYIPPSHCTAPPSMRILLNVAVAAAATVPIKIQNFHGYRYHF